MSFLKSNFSFFFNFIVASILQISSTVAISSNSFIHCFISVIPVGIPDSTEAPEPSIKQNFFFPFRLSFIIVASLFAEMIFPLSNSFLSAIISPTLIIYIKYITNFAEIQSIFTNSCKRSPENLFSVSGVNELYFIICGCPKSP